MLLLGLYFFTSQAVVEHKEIPICYDLKLFGMH